MSVNASLPLRTIFDQLFSCFRTTTGALCITAFTIVNIFLLLPLCILVLHLGLQKWRQQRSRMMMSPADLITYHTVLGEVISLLGTTSILCGIYTDFPLILMVGMGCFSMQLFGQVMCHILTCLERYLAVIHPITYRSLRKRKGIRITNITIGCVWLLSFALIAALFRMDFISGATLSLCSMCLSLSFVFFCSLSVLCVLIRPGPGEGGGKRQRADHSKLRAFYTITIILGVLLFNFGGNILISSVYATVLLDEAERCGMWLFAIWLSLPSSLVLPLLFLQRAGKPMCCKNNKKSGQGSD